MEKNIFGVLENLLFGFLANPQLSATFTKLEILLCILVLYMPTITGIIKSLQTTVIYFDTHLM